MTHSLHLDLPPNVYTPLSNAASRAGATPEVFITEILAAVTQNLHNDPLEKFIGAFPSIAADWVDKHDQHLADMVMETHETTEQPRQ